MGQDIGYCRSVTSGIIHFIEEHQVDWVIHDAPSDVRVLPNLLDWQPDGIIVHLFDQQLAHELSALHIPMISTTETLKRTRIPIVDVDNHAVGELAANFFLRKGYRNFGYYGSSIARFSQKRRQAFETTLQAKGFALSCLEANFLPRPPFATPWDEIDLPLQEWLISLAKPVAILASNDLPARILCEVCRQLNLKIPKDVAILGVDNDTSECRMASTSISSIDTPASQIGYRAAKLLNELLHDPSAKITNHRFQPLGVVERASTDPNDHLSLNVRKALGIIVEEAHTGISIADISRKCGVSRRSMERLFKSELNTTMLSEIHHSQVEHAQRLLLETDLHIEAIADRTGFGSARKFSRLFQKYIGSSPGVYRKKLKRS